MATVIILVVAGVAFLAAFVALHWYAWRRLVRDTTTRRSPLRRFGTAVFIAGPVLGLAAVRDDMPGIPFAFEGVIDWPGFMWLALFLYTVLALAIGELVRPPLRWYLARRDTSSRTPSGPPDLPQKAATGSSDHPAHGSPVVVASQTGAEAGTAEPALSAAMSRRMFVSRVVGGTAAAAALGTVGYGTYGVMRGPQLKRLSIPLAKLPRSAHGFRIAVVSDIHLGPILGRRFTQRVVDTINSTQPDLIAVVGDLVDGSVDELADAVEPLTQLRARHGSYFVTGNHEYFNDPADWITKVRDLGLVPLENARTEMPGFDLAGVNDVMGKQTARAPTSPRPSATATALAQRSCSPTSPSSSTTP
ncbi:hypothetical protein Q0Z83_019640 [Actinoplanes sichuanensis]|uniref:Metallophosphoesterase n=1 Tax=Actinoplanes sichuanensis TaxID=512349 RepID=A0ABW4AKN0_9ACTN|nr:metallophosphoesterase [Actinoplanes sichuanensis]BEL03773.1 hypothetical protein Q0Z83_019640 [Actinoplanes sichuanensis]